MDWKRISNLRISAKSRTDNSIIEFVLMKENSTLKIQNIDFYSKFMNQLLLILIEKNVSFKEIYFSNLSFGLSGDS